jgi:hypothetical protein
MVGLGTRSTIERVEIGNSRPKVARASALPDRCDKTSFALLSAYCIAVSSFCTGSSTLESPHRIIPLIEHESSRMV